MVLIQKMLTGFIERTFGHYITTIIAILSVALFAFNNFGTMIPAQYHDFANIAAILVQGVALALAKDKGIKLPVDVPSPVKLTGKAPVILLLIGLIVFGLVPAVSAQETLQNFYAVGASYSVNASPSVAGTGLYARRLADSGTFAFTVVDAVPNTLRPFTVNTNIGFGVAQKVFTIKKTPIYIPTSAGVSWNGNNTGWQWNTGAMALIKVKGGYIAPSVRLLKSSVSNGTGYQPVIGIMYGWGS